MRLDFLANSVTHERKVYHTTVLAHGVCSTCFYVPADGRRCFACSPFPTWDYSIALAREFDALVDDDDFDDDHHESY